MPAYVDTAEAEEAAHRGTTGLRQHQEVLLDSQQAR